MRDGLLGSETPNSQSWGGVLGTTAVELAMKRPIGTAVLILAVTVVAAAAQDMMNGRAFRDGLVNLARHGRIHAGPKAGVNGRTVERLAHE